MWEIFSKITKSGVKNTGRNWHKKNVPWGVDRGIASLGKPGKTTVRILASPSHFFEIHFSSTWK